jgi:hypothetical protein
VTKITIVETYSFGEYVRVNRWEIKGETTSIVCVYQGASVFCWAVGSGAHDCRDYGGSLGCVVTEEVRASVILCILRDTEDICNFDVPVI